METTELLDHAFAWTATRIATVREDQLDAPTPCTLWNLRELLDHTIGSVTMLTDAVSTTGVTAADVPALGPSSWDEALAELAARNAQAWTAPGVMDRSFELPFGTQPAASLAAVTALELIVHGWDISQASGEAAEIPEALARPVLEFARQALGEANRGDNFAADVGIGDTTSDRLVAFLGRKPL